MSDADTNVNRKSRPLRLHHDRFPGEPLLDTAVSHAMLRRVASGAVGESLRIYRPENVLLFSSLDSKRKGYARALALAEEAGFPGVIRLAGGQAAAFLEESIAFAWAIPDHDAHLHIRPRFEALSNWIAESLRRLGLDVRVGSIPGEYCPGEYSVNLEGRVKVMGVGQRVIRGGAHVGGVITLGQTSLLRETLSPIYEALDLEFHPETAGGVADFDPSLTCDRVIASMKDALLESGREFTVHSFDDSILREAEQLFPLHESIASTAREKRVRLGEILRASRSDSKTLVQDE